MLIDLAKKVDDMKARPDWNEIKQKIYEEDKAEIDELVKEELEGWNYGDPYFAGLSSGRIEYVFLSKASYEVHKLEASILGPF